MKVFGCRRYGVYSGGLIIIAANSIEEAIKIARQEGYSQQCYDYFSSDFFEYELLSYNGDSPCVIDEDGYSE